MEQELKHLVRIAATEIPGRLPVEQALAKIQGIGVRTARCLAIKAGIDPQRKIGSLDDSQLELLESQLGQLESSFPGWMLNQRKDYHTGKDLHIYGPEYVLKVVSNILRMIRIRCYKGWRHERGYKVRGQRTRSTGRVGAVVGVSKKK